MTEVTTNGIRTLVREEDPYFSTLASCTGICGSNGNSGNINVSQTTESQCYNPGSAATYANIKKMHLDVIDKGYKVTWWPESIPSSGTLINLYADHTSGSSTNDYHYTAYIFSKPFCDKSSASSYMSISVGHKAQYPTTGGVQKTLENALDEIDLFYWKDGYGVSGDKLSSNVAINRTAGTVTATVQVKDYKIPYKDASKGFSVFTYAAQKKDNVYTYVCRNAPIQAKSSCKFPDPTIAASSSTSTSASSSTGDSGGNGWC